MTLTAIQALVDAIEDNGLNTAAEARTVLNALKNESCRLYQVIELDIPAASFAAYMTANFDVSGLGIGASGGLALCNGANGTTNRKGRTSIGYDPAGYPTIGALGGNKDAVTVAHTHNFVIKGGSGGSGGVTYQDGVTTNNNYVTESTGVVGTGKNMQPYVVTLFAQRIS